MKRFLFFSVTAVFVFTLMAFDSYFIQNLELENCSIKKFTVTNITHGGGNDIVFHDNSLGFHYINRGLEHGLNLEDLKDKVIDKTVTLHLAKVFGGITTDYIAQLSIGDEVIYSEFR